jgi:hypothetical protein
MVAVELPPLTRTPEVPRLEPYPDNLLDNVVDSAPGP